MSESQWLAQVRAVWADILELPLSAVAPDSHFLHLGGDSLHWMRMAAQLEQRFGRTVPAQLQVEWATPERCVRQWCDGVVEETTAPGREEAVLDTHCFPATPMQRGIWFAQQLAGDETLYAGALVLHFNGALDMARMQAALQHLYAALPLLRARFRLDPVCRRLMVDCPEVCGSATTVRLETEHLHHDDLPTALAAWAAGPEAQVGPCLFRVKLFHSGAQEFHLALQLHHLVSDGWSGSLLLSRLAGYYNGEAADPDLALDRTFARHAWRLAREAAPPTAVLDHWRGRLEGYADAQRPLFPQTAETRWPHAVEHRTLHLPAGLRVACELAAHALGVTPFVLCLTACKLVLSRLHDEPRQVLAIPRAARGAGEERAIGCFVALQLSASYLPAQIEAGTLLREESRRFTEDTRHSIALDTLGARLAPARLPDGNPWSTVLLAFQNYPQATPSWQGLACRIERLAAARSQYALSLEFLPAGSDWLLRIDHAPALFTGAWLERFQSALLDALQELAY